MNAILDVIQPAGEDVFRRVAPKAPAPSTSEGSSHYFAFRRDAPDAQPKISPMFSDEVESRYGARLGEDGTDGRYNEIQSLLSRRQHLPRFTTKEIDVVEEILSSGAVTHVRVMSHDEDDVGIDSHITAKDLLCKATDASGGIMAWPTLWRELACLLTLREHNNQAASLSSPSTKPMRVCTPRLVGVVTHIVGCVREWIPGERLTDVLKRGTPLSVHKQRWAQQLCKSVDALHALGLIWGDGEKEDTIEGHEQAVQKILEALRL